MCSDGYCFGDGDVNGMVNGDVKIAFASAVPDPGHCSDHWNRYSTGSVNGAVTVTGAVAYPGLSSRSQQHSP